MAIVALMFGIISFFRMVWALIKLLTLQMTAEKREGIIETLLTVEADYKSRKNTEMNTFVVRFFDDTSAIYQELVRGNRDLKVHTGWKYTFYVREGTAQIAKRVIMEPLIQFGLLACCVAILFATGLFSIAL